MGISLSPEDHGVAQADSAMRADSVEGNAPFFQELHKVGTGHVEKVRSLLGREFRTDRENLDAVATCERARSRKAGRA